MVAGSSDAAQKAVRVRRDMGRLKDSVATPTVIELASKYERSHK